MNVHETGDGIEHNKRWPNDEHLIGFGHRVYRGRDPRADVLKATARKQRTTS